jgi:hypothetical protein
MEEIERHGSCLVELYNEVHKAAQMRKFKAFSDELAYVTHAIRQVCKYNTELTINRIINNDMEAALQRAGFVVKVDRSPGNVFKTVISWDN